MNVHHPAFQSVIAPLVLVLAWALAALLSGRARAASGGVVPALLLSLLLVSGLPGWPPASAVQKFTLATALSLIPVTALGNALGRPRVAPLVLAGLLAASLSWLAWPQRGSLPVTALVQVASLAVAGMFTFARVRRAAPQPLAAPLLVSLLALGLAAVAFIGGSLVLLQAAMALAVACAGYAVLLALGLRLAMGPATLLLATVALCGLGLLVIRLTSVPAYVLLPLLLITVCDLPAGRLPAPGGRLGALLRGIYVASFAVLPLAAAVGLAQLARRAPDLYYQ